MVIVFSLSLDIISFMVYDPHTMGNPPTGLDSIVIKGSSK